ncbi:MAG: ribosome maturation factor RimM [Pseudomonadota bacterium]
MNEAKLDMVAVGAIIGAHGVRGDVRIKSFTAEPEALFDYAPFMSEHGEVLLEPVKARPVKDHFVVTPKSPRQKEEWDALKSTRLFVSKSALPETDDDEFYINDLVGLDVFIGGNEKIGRVKAVLNHGAGDLIEIQRLGRGKPVLVPFTIEDVPVVDLKLSRIVVANFDLWQDDSRPDDAP